MNLKIFNLFRKSLNTKTQAETPVVIAPSIEDILSNITIEEVNGTAIINVSKNLEKNTAYALYKNEKTKLIVENNYITFFDDNDGEFKRIIFTQDEIRYEITLYSNNKINFKKDFHINEDKFTTFLSYNKSSINYSEFQHEAAKNFSSKCLTQIYITPYSNFTMGQNTPHKESPETIDENYYDWNKLYDLVSEFKNLNNEYFNEIINNFIDLKDSVNTLVRKTI